MTVAIAGLAVHLLPPGNPGSHDARDVTAAVKLATLVYREASKPTVEHYAYELFPRDGVMSMDDIRETFEAHDWKALGSKTSVSKRVRELLDFMYVDVQTRRAILITAFRRGLPGVTPEDGERMAGVCIRTLLRDLGMDTAFGRQLDDTVDRFRIDLVEAWLKVNSLTKTDFERMPLASSSLFSAICVDSSYEEYATAMRPPEGLGSDDLLAIIVWVDIDLRVRLLQPKKIDEVLGTLHKLNHWPDTLRPGDRRFSAPFAECISELARSHDEQEGLIKKFDLGVQRFRRILALLMLVEFSKNCPAESAIERLQEIGERWNELETGDKGKFSDMFAADPTRSIQSLTDFLRGENPFFPSEHRLPFHGIGVTFPVLRPYVRDLDSLLLIVREVRELARWLGPTKDSKGTEEAATDENAREPIGPKGLTDGMREIKEVADGSDGPEDIPAGDHDENAQEPVGPKGLTDGMREIKEVADGSDGPEDIPAADHDENAPEAGNDVLGEIETAVRNEKARVTRLSAELADPGSDCAKEKVKYADELLKEVVKFTPGRINPYRLFRYAFERRLLEDILVKKES